MRTVTVSFVALLLMAAPLLAQEPVEQEQQHVVKKGDTLWDLAGVYYTNPFRWPVIYEANTAVVEDPHWIYPEEVLRIPGTAAEMTPRPRPVVIERPADRSTRTVFYRAPAVQEPGTTEPTVLSEPTMARVPVRSGEFTSAPFVTRPSELRVLGQYVRPLRDRRAVRGAPSPAQPQDVVILSYRNEVRPQIDNRFLLVDVGRSVPGTARGTRLVHPRGIVRITQLSEHTMQGQLEALYGPIYGDELLVPIPMYPDFQVEEAERTEPELPGRLLDFVDEQTLYGKTALGFIDLGARDGVAVGDLFRAYLPERASRATDPTDLRQRIDRLPPEPVAELRVVRVTDGNATVKVDRLMLPQLEPGLSVWRVGRIP